MGRSKEQKPFLISDEEATKRFVDLLDDIDADTFAYMLEQAFGGKVEANEDGTYTVTPNENYSGGLDVDRLFGNYGPKLDPEAFVEEYQEDLDNFKYKQAKDKNKR